MRIMDIEDRLEAMGFENFRNDGDSWWLLGSEWFASDNCTADNPESRHCLCNDGKGVCGGGGSTVCHPELTVDQFMVLLDQIERGELKP